MVVCKAHPFHHIGCYGILVEDIKYFRSINAGINEQPCRRSAYVGTIAAAAAAETDKAQRIVMRRGCVVVWRVDKCRLVVGFTCSLLITCWREVVGIKYY